MRLLDVSVFLLVLISGISTVCGQGRVVSGTVRDSLGFLIGANVLEKGTRNGVQTDFDGRFSINVSDPNATLIISYLGYGSREVALSGQISLDVRLQANPTYLDEAVIIGYGTTTVKDATGALVGISERKFNGGFIISPELLIQGKAPGVQLTVTSGEPGAGIETRIRGSNSIRSDNNPLFVVDGVPLDGRATAVTGSNKPPRNPLNFLNPSDIANISVLKDASATAIYGSRGANGVVIITTKSGKAAGDGGFQFSSSVSIASSAREYDLLNREGFLAGISQLGGNSEEADFGGKSDWQDFISRTSVSEDLNLSWSRNYGQGNLFAAVGFADQYGIIKNSSLERITGRLNWSHRFFDNKLELSFRGTLSEVNDEVNEQVFFGGGSALALAYRTNPTIPTNLDFIPPGVLTPSGFLKFQQITSNTNRYFFNLSADYAFTPQLSAKLATGYDDSRSSTVSLNSEENLDTPFRGAGDLYEVQRVTNLLEATLTYHKDFRNSSLEVLLGYAYQRYRTSGRNVSGRGFQTTDLHQMETDLHNTLRSAAQAAGGSYQQFFYGTNWDNLKVNRLFNSNGDPDLVVGEEIPFQSPLQLQALTADYQNNTDELQSFFGRINYSIEDKYLFTATIRADGSSRFGPENQYGYFPSGAFAWKIAEENFMGPGFSTLKLRLSAGLTGNQEGLGYGNFVARQRFASLEINNDNSIVQNGLTIIATDVPDLKWETTLDFNIGLDWGIDLDRLRGSLDIYRRETKDLLLQTPPAAPSTNPFQFSNVDALVINKGIELAVSYDFVETTDTNFGAAFNIAYNHNEIKDFINAINIGAVYGPGVNGSFVQRFESGVSLAAFYMAEFAGFDSNGNPTYRDIDGNGSGNPDRDKFFVGQNGLPAVTSGLSLNFQHKNWVASALFYGQFGFSVYNNTANAFFNASQLATGQNVTRGVLGSDENASASANVSTRFLERGDYVRLQNASIGYNVPLENTGVLKSLFLHLTGQNIFIITGYSGLDPEVNTDGANFLNGIPTAGMDFLAYPRPRVITFGVTAKF